MVKKKRRKRKRKSEYRKKLDKRAKVIARIFDSTTDDLSYITCDEHLLKLHIRYINHCDETINDSVQKYIVDSGKNKGKYPKSFTTFYNKYKYIYTIWMKLVDRCFNKDSDLYQFFGARKISMNSDFLDGKKFCIWCLKHGVTRKPFMYDQYIQRRDKNKNYSAKNCFVVTEKEIHHCTSVPLILQNVRLIKLYNERHDPSVNYLTFYTRYYMYDLSEEEARMWPYTKKRSDIYGFSSSKFYQSVATEDSCKYSVFLSRMHYSYLNGGFNARPYAMLDPSFSVNEEANSQGTLSYKQAWDREHLDKYKNVYTNTKSDENELDKSNDVYSTDESLDVYN